MNFAHCRVLCWPALWILLCLASCLQAAILRVPADFPGIQAAMDASSPGDTVHVAPGIWYGLYTSPTHGLTLCSDYLFTQDSTAINATILDGEYAGTILDLYCEDEWFVLCGFTVQHGQGQDLSPGAFNYRAGCIQKNGAMHARISDCVFRQNRAPRSASVLYWGTVGSGIPFPGGLILERISCFENEITNPDGSADAVINIRGYQSSLEISGLYYDGNGNNSSPIIALVGMAESVSVSNVIITNTTGPWAGRGFSSEIIEPTSQHYSNIRLIGGNGVPVCGLAIQAIGPDSSVTVIRNIQATGVREQQALYIRSQLAQLDVDSLTVSDCRNSDTGPLVTVDSDTRGWLNNVHFHHNVSGDSVSLQPHPLLYTRYMDINNLHFHDNRSIVPPHPDMSNSGGNFISGAMVYATGSRLHLSNMLFENNRVDDLDDYSDLSPEYAYYPNPGRELFAGAWTGLWARNIRVLHSHQPNFTPEIISADGLALSHPGAALSLGSYHFLHADSILVWDADDGGVYFGADSVWASNIELRDVGRMALGMGTNVFPQAPPWYRFRNLYMENIDASPIYLPPELARLSNQALLFLDVRTDFQGHEPVIEFENVTAINCDGMRHLFNFYEPVDLRVRNCILWNNTYDHLVQWDDPITQTWEYNILQEPVPGIGNQVGVDPWFDEELGAPWLSPISPAIDAGHLDLVYNDIEDPDNPGFALWPSQGTLRNDIGYTGGPTAGTLEHWVAVRQPASRPPVTLPQGFTLHPAYPNPFNPSTTLSYTLTRPMQVELSVYDLLGQQVRTLAFGLQEAGEHSVPFTAGELASGVYVVELQAGGHSQTQKVLLLK